MTRFVTLPRREGIGPVLLWEETEEGLPKVISMHASVDAIEDAASLQHWRIDVTTTAEPGAALNPGRFPLLDANGVPLWQDVRISFRLPTHFINRVDGKGAFRKADIYGGIYLLSDEPINVYDRSGFIRDRRREQYSPLGTYHHDGVCKGFKLMSGSIGDPHEHGRHDIHIRVAEDVRTVCVLEYDPAPAPTL